MYVLCYGHRCGMVIDWLIEWFIFWNCCLMPCWYYYWQLSRWYWIWWTQIYFMILPTSTNIPNWGWFKRYLILAVALISSNATVRNVIKRDTVYFKIHVFLLKLSHCFTLSCIACIHCYQEYVWLNDIFNMQAFITFLFKVFCLGWGRGGITVLHIHTKNSLVLRVY